MSEKSSHEERVGKLLEESDASREELLLAIEDANDNLAVALDLANKTVSKGDVRPTTIVAFRDVERAAMCLTKVDPTRTMDPDEEPEEDDG